MEQIKIRELQTSLIPDITTGNFLPMALDTEAGGHLPLTRKVPLSHCVSGGAVFADFSSGLYLSGNQVLTGYNPDLDIIRFEESVYLSSGMGLFIDDGLISGKSNLSLTGWASIEGDLNVITGDIRAKNGSLFLEGGISSNEGDLDLNQGDVNLNQGNVRIEGGLLVTDSVKWSSMGNDDNFPEITPATGAIFNVPNLTTTTAQPKWDFSGEFRLSPHPDVTIDKEAKIDLKNSSNHSWTITAPSTNSIDSVHELILSSSYPGTHRNLTLGSAGSEVNLYAEGSLNSNGVYSKSIKAQDELIVPLVNSTASVNDPKRGSIVLDDNSDCYIYDGTDWIQLNI
jgi:hypothetical protein